MDFKNRYKFWLENSLIDEGTKLELRNINDDEKEIEDRFYKELEFGTGGLRGVIGAGTNRMNIYTVGKATQGLGDYLNGKFENPAVAIAYDSRHMSKEFAEYTAKTLCGNNIKTYLFETLTPTPILSYAVRALGCSGGIVITASHNPKQYNGYKVYGADGGQITDKDAKEILSYIGNVDSFEKVKNIDLETCKSKGLLEYVGENVYSTYIEKVKALTIRKELVEKSAKDLKIIYTPIHGSGNVPVRRVLKELGYENLQVVKEQELPNGDFPTAPYPNPEDPKVFKLALDMAKESKPDIILGTDPDCDRIGAVIQEANGEYKVLTGNQVGALLSHYIMASLKELNQLPNNGAIIKTIVSTDMIKPIGEKYGVEIIEVLTGFKYIGELIGNFEETNSNKFLFGFEESYGYLSGDFVRDKDAVIAAMLITEMTLYYKSKGKTLYEALMELYKEYGFYKENLVSIDLKGKEGQEKIAATIDFLRNTDVSYVASFKVTRKMDYKLSIERDLLTGDEDEINLPKSNVLKFILNDGSWFVVRPSGTEPKMKIYIATAGDSLENADEKLKVIEKAVLEAIDKYIK
ncbi:phospho-sugar mutase [Clostridium sp.]|uniref:phospho-sugar mutase n=1 Tax=Clostridium sp. TaxID=1506 RepID=UPI002FCC1A21